MSESVLARSDHAISTPDRNQGRRLSTVEVPHLPTTLTNQISLFRRQAMHDHQATSDRRPRLQTGDSFRKTSAASRAVQRGQLLDRGITPHRRIHRKAGQSSLAGHHQTVGYEFTVGYITA